VCLRSVCGWSRIITKLSFRFGQIKDLFIEADYWARKEISKLVLGRHWNWILLELSGSVVVRTLRILLVLTGNSRIDSIS
jgi:hypothetical protein